jgi:exodeoxyribonuclease X
MTGWSARRYVVVDVEGNGQQPPDLVELGTVTVVDGIIGEPRAWLFRPEAPITVIARRVHGISNQDVAQAPVRRAGDGPALRSSGHSARRRGRVV